ncbi:hypothetical protein ACVWYS_001670 [Arthrobacter sp. TE12231]|uniref:Uncharacterized protein n=1 Tax=Arthrobacter humicola TaxID=409291 RepID=A0ABN2ZI11_9MICC
MTMLRSPSRRGGRRGTPLPDTFDARGFPEDWGSIKVGSSVEVVISAHHAYVGRTDSKTPDSAVVRVVSAGCHGRRMYGHRDGIRLLGIIPGGTA